MLNPPLPTHLYLLLFPFCLFHFFLLGGGGDEIYRCAFFFVRFQQPLETVQIGVLFFFALLSFSCFKLFVLFMLIHQGKVEGRGRE